MRPNSALLPLLLFATVAVNGVAGVVAHEEGWELPILMLLALCFGQMSLLGIWLTLGTGLHWLLRVLICAGTVALWAALHRLYRAPTMAEAASVFVAQVAAVALVALLWRIAGFRWRRVALFPGEVSGAAAERRWQFSIGQILGWTTVMAVLAFLVKFAEFPLDFAMLAVIAVNVLIAAAMLHFARSGGFFLFRFAGAAVVSLLVGIVLSAPVRSPELLPFALVQGPFIFVWIKICELGGYGIQRLGSEPITASPANLLVEDPPEAIGNPDNSPTLE